MNHPILAENQSKQLIIRLPLLCCFAMFAVWQIGVVFYSGTSFSIDGKTPLPFEIGSQPILIAAGSVCSILFIWAVPHLVVWAERVITIVALASSLMLFLPVAPELQSAAYLIQCFCCALGTGFETTVIVNLFDLKTGLTHILCAYSVAMVFVAALHNQVLPVPFSVFRVVIVVTLALMMLFFIRLPTGTTHWPRYAKKSDGLACPRRLFIGLYALGGLGVLLYWFSSAIAESHPDGLTVLYLSGAAFGFIVFLLWKKRNISPVRSGIALMGITTVGFGVGISSLFFPALSMVASVLFGAGIVLWTLAIAYGQIMMRQYPSRHIAPGIITIACIALAVHMILLEVLRGNPAVLYSIYLVIAVALVVLYLILQPYLIYSFQGRSLVAEETGSAGDSGSPKTEFLRAAAFDALTDTELMIAERVLRGYSNKEIGAELGYSESTIKTYRKNLYSKLQIHSPRELFLLAEKERRD